VISSRIQRLSSAHSEQVKALKIWRYCKFEWSYIYNKQTNTLFW
jgi:hypothetical protein